MKKPTGMLYGVDDTPPLPVTFLGSVQYVLLIAIRLIFPLLVAREAGLSEAVILDVLGLSMIVIGFGTVLQGLPRGPVGSGYLCPSTFTSAYIAPSMLAAKVGGIALVAGMTVFAGLLECVLSRVLRPLRPYFPPEIAGLVVVVIGVMLGALGTRNILGVGTSHGATPASIGVVVLTLGLMVAFNVWGKGIWRILSPLIGMAAGCIGAVATGIVDATTFAPLLAAPSFHVPSLAHAGWTFEIGFVVPFTIAAVAACLRATGDLTTCQKINDADWKRPDLKTLSRGALANGLATAAGGLVGTLGVNTFTNGVGLSSATGLASRRIAYPIGAAFVALAFLPKVGALLLVMPAPVLGAVLWFSAAFVLVNGLQIVMSRMFDTRRTLVFGLSFTIALSVDLYPSVFASAPVTVQPITGSALVLGMVVALVLNAVFRVGVRRTQAITVLPEEIDPETVTEFMNRQGAAWGARRDVIERATFNLLQSLDTIASLSTPAVPIAVEASFDEFHVDLRVAYDGPQLELPTERPSPEEIMNSVAGEQRLAGFMLRRLADGVTTGRRGTQSVVSFRFDH